VLTRAFPVSRNLIVRRQLHQRPNPWLPMCPTDMVNIMQADIMSKLRKDPTNAALRDGMLITINGIASGMRNTG
jgi:phosphoenolpyruvate carboxylase